VNITPGRASNERCTYGRVAQNLIVSYLAASAIIFTAIVLFYIGYDLPSHLASAVAAAVLAALYFVYARSTGEPWDSAFSLFLGFHTLYSVGGVVVYELREMFWFNYPAAMDVVGRSILAATFAAIAGRVAGALLGNIAIPRPVTRLVFETNTLELAIWACIAVGNIAAMLLYDFYQRIPLFAVDIDQARVNLTQYSSGRGLLFILQLLLVLGIPLAYYRYKTSAKSTPLSLAKFGVQCGACLFPLAFYGGRFYLFSPLLLLALTHSAFVKRVSLFRGMLGGVSVLVMAMIFVAIRVFGPDTDLYYASRAVWADIFPEMRMFGYVAKTVGPLGIYREILVNLVSGLFPSALLAALGIEKRELLFSVGLFVSQNTGNFGVGIRTGLVGESFLAHGYIGVVITFFGVGLLATLITNSLARLPAGDARRFSLICTGLFLALAVPYGSNMLLTTFFVTIFSQAIQRAASHVE
jgi:hypothetical protein